MGIPVNFTRLRLKHNYTIIEYIIEVNETRQLLCNLPSLADYKPTVDPALINNPIIAHFWILWLQ